MWELMLEDEKSRNFLLALCATIMALLAGLRFETGGDWDTYKTIFESAPLLSNIAQDGSLLIRTIAEPGFLLLCSIFRTCHIHIQWLFFLISVFNISLLAVTLKRYTPYPAIALVCYFSILYFSLEFIYIRQATAIVICFYALRFIKEKRLWPYLVCIALACLFHQTALLMMPMYWLLDRSYSRLLMIVTVLFGCGIMVAKIPWFSSLFETVTTAMGGAAAKKAEVYTDNNVMSVERVISIGFFINLLMFAAVMYFKERIEERPFGKIHVNMYVISLLMYYYCYELIEVSNRLRLAFFISIIVLLPEIISLMPMVWRKTLAYGVVLLYCFTFCRGILLEAPESTAYTPYQCAIEYLQPDKEKLSTGQERLDRSHHFFNKDRKR